MSTDSKLTREQVLAVLDKAVRCDPFGPVWPDQVSQARAAVEATYDEVERLRGEVEARKEETKHDILNIFKLRGELADAKRDAERMDWLVKRVTHVTHTLGDDAVAYKTMYKLPVMISYAEFCGDIGFREAIDLARERQ